ncbi:MAG: diguanylate cyclase [Synergistales bacterium]|nr:diguanylate cyclase [Synergistales bacterium]
MPLNRLMDDEQLMMEVLKQIYDGVYMVDLDRKILFWNSGAERITGYTAEEVTGRRCSDNILIHVNEKGINLCTNGCPLHKTLEDGLNREMEVFLHHREGFRVPVMIRVSPIKDQEGNIIGAVEVFSDNSRLYITRRKLRQAEKEADLDPLTEIFNRRYTEKALSLKLEEMEQLELKPLGLLFIDIDHFKRVNDTYSHETGDRVLKMVAETLRNILRREDILCRWGGEEFLVAIPSTSREELEEVGERIRVVVSSCSLHVPSGSLSVTLSIGGVLAKKGETLMTVVNRADRMMYLSKKRGRNLFTLEE